MTTAAPVCLLSSLLQPSERQQPRPRCSASSSSSGQPSHSAPAATTTTTNATKKMTPAKKRTPARSSLPRPRSARPGGACAPPGRSSLRSRPRTTRTFPGRRRCGPRQVRERDVFFLSVLSLFFFPNLLPLTPPSAPPPLLLSSPRNENNDTGEYTAERLKELSRAQARAPAALAADVDSAVAPEVLAALGQIQGVLAVRYLPAPA